MKKITIIIILALIIILLSVAIIMSIQNHSYLCKKKVKGNGICAAYFEGYEFDNSIDKCVKKGVSGCGFESPFIKLEECQKVCE